MSLKTIPAAPTITTSISAVKNYVFPKLRDVIKDADPQAFTIVTSAQEIYGEGYTEHGGEG